MAGNVDEWVEDCWHGSYEGAPTDGSAWTSHGCDSRVLRGGSYDNRTAEIGSAYRYYWFPYGDMPTFGFRVAKTL
jgi:formylglycine-generating enzyme required for sulfatase activity